MTLSPSLSSRFLTQTHNLDIEDLKSIIDVKGRGSRTTTFFKEIALSVPYRTLSSISQYLRAHFATLSVKGPFSREEDEEIIRGREVEGKGWVEIGKGLDRRGEDVRKRYTNHLEIRGSKQNGESWAAGDFRVSDLVRVLIVR